jgi:hypothetical protein
MTPSKAHRLDKGEEECGGDGEKVEPDIAGCREEVAKKLGIFAE